MEHYDIKASTEVSSAHKQLGMVNYQMLQYKIYSTCIEEVSNLRK